MKNKIITIFGAPNSGKTTTSIKLANYFSKRKKNVILIFADPFTPTIPYIYPGIDMEGKSLGSILSAPDINKELLLSKCLITDKNEYISFLGYAHSENVYSYAQYNKERVVDLLILLKHMVDYVIVDCSSTFTADLFSTVAIELADHVLRLSNANLKSASYFESSLPLLADKRFKSDRHIQVLSNVMNMEPVESINELYYGVRYKLPHAPEVYDQFLAGTLFRDFVQKDSVRYVDAFGQLVKEVDDDFEVIEDVKPKKQKSKEKKIKVKGKSLKELMKFGK